MKLVLDLHLLRFVVAHRLPLLWHMHPVGHAPLHLGHVPKHPAVVAHAYVLVFLCTTT
jgi:hypothetical protein